MQPTLPALIFMSAHLISASVRWGRKGRREGHEESHSSTRAPTAPVIASDHAALSSAMFHGHPSSLSVPPPPPPPPPTALQARLLKTNEALFAGDTSPTSDITSEWDSEDETLVTAVLEGSKLGNEQVQESNYDSSTDELMEAVKTETAILVGGKQQGNEQQNQGNYESSIPSTTREGQTSLKTTEDSVRFRAELDLVRKRAIESRDEAAKHKKRNARLEDSILKLRAVCGQQQRQIKDLTLEVQMHQRVLEKLSAQNNDLVQAGQELHVVIQQVRADNRRFRTQIGTLELSNRRTPRQFRRSELTKPQQWTSSKPRGPS